MPITVATPPSPRPLRAVFAGRLLALVLATAAIASLPSTASAQATPTTTNREVTSTAKGILGGGILGAEIGFIVPALLVNAGVRELDEVWSWILFPSLGAIGGGIAGYFALEEPANGMTASGEVRRGFPEVAVAVFVSSLVLIVPTFVGVLALTSYNPARDARGAGASEDEAPAASREPPLSPFAGGPGLLRMDRGRFLLGVPMVGPQNRYTEEETAALGLPPAADWHVPVVSGAF